MRLTTARLKKLIREELAHMDETRVYQPGEAPLSADRYNPEAVDALMRFKLELEDKLNKLNKGASMGPRGTQQHERNIKNYEQLRKGIAHLTGKLKNNELQMNASEAMRELQMMVPGSDAFFN